MSKLINKTRLQKFAEDFWAKIKGRYDVAFKEARISASDSADKKITLTRISETNPVDVDLSDYARLQDRNEFKKDVSVDNAKVVSNVSVGELNGPVTAGSRTTGYRGLTSKLFTDGYVKLLRVHLPQEASGSVNAHVWAIKKGALKTEDKYDRKIVKTATVQTAGTNKYIDIDIDSTFADETFFVLRTEGTQIQGIHNIKQEFRDDIINVNQYFNPQSTDTLANWSTYNPINNLVGYMELHGRTGIVDISKRLDEIDTASGNYVLQSETTTTGGAGNANKVARLDQAGKLDATMLPAIAINEYFTATDFTHDALSQLTFQNGDVVVVTKGNKAKRYLCVDKAGHTSNLTEAFVELNDKSGVVTSVNDVTGAVTLKIEATTEKLQLKVNDTMKSEVDIISDAEITEILNALQ